MVLLKYSFVPLSLRFLTLVFWLYGFLCVLISEVICICISSKFQVVLIATSVDESSVSGKSICYNTVLF
jgi:hypothetical protein